NDGVQFSIAFNKKGDTASLMFAGHSTAEILENRRLASGIEYGNDDYAFREHQGAVKLIDLTEDEEQSTVCHKVKTAP
ncbi:MAG TPA: hypothetical protein VFR09_06195, partial [Alphaproteobacteria bacterium]|nr:hypothetical protein [Alphaproteobacteria bacterium]